MNFIIGILTVVAILYVIRQHEENVEDVKTLKDRLNRAESHAELLTNFICESPVLRGDAKQFIARGFHCGHYSGNGSENCTCLELTGRMGSMVDNNNFYRALDEKNPTEQWGQDEDRKRAKGNQQTILPYMKRLNILAPKSVTDEHLKWLMRAGLSN